jgi:hypothetical protein
MRKEYGTELSVDTGANEMTPDELIKILKRYLLSSNPAPRAETK